MEFCLPIVSPKEGTCHKPDMTKQIITKNLLVHSTYEWHLGISIPFGLDIIVFFPMGHFELTIKDHDKLVLVTRISHEEHQPRQLHISALQYKLISENPHLHIRTVDGTKDHELSIMFVLF
jgi:hypothetical protein